MGFTNSLTPMGNPLISTYPINEYRTVLGLISGTSADGVDVACVKFPPVGLSDGLELISFQTIPYPAELKQRVLDASEDKLTLRQTAVLHTDLGCFFGEVASQALPEGGCHLVASHGQTVCHLPGQQTTLQLGEGAFIANRTGVLTITDFRPADLALGGQGAPLVPVFDRHLLAHKERSRIAVNLGGIANITVIPADSDKITAWDTGPANCVSDAICRAHHKGDFDPDGRMAGDGEVDQTLLARLLGLDYFQLSPPKSTGLEDFGREFAALHFTDGDFPSLLRTAVALSAQSLVNAIEQASADMSGSPLDLVFAGGGTSNLTLMMEIRQRLASAWQHKDQDTPGFLTFADFRISEESREAVAFAYLGDRTARGLTGALPSTTGASRAAILGKISVPAP